MGFSDTPSLNEKGTKGEYCGHLCDIILLQNSEGQCPHLAMSGFFELETRTPATLKSARLPKPLSPAISTWGPTVDDMNPALPILLDKKPYFP